MTKKTAGTREIRHDFQRRKVHSNEPPKTTRPSGAPAGCHQKVTVWTEDDTDDLREMADALLTGDDAHDVRRAAKELERLAARVAELETRLADTVTLLDAGRSSGLMRRNPQGRKLLDAVRAVLAEAEVSVLKEPKS